MNWLKWITSKTCYVCTYSFVRRFVNDLREWCCTWQAHAGRLKRRPWSVSCFGAHVNLPNDRELLNYRRIGESGQSLRSEPFVIHSRLMQWSSDHVHLFISIYCRHISETLRWLYGIIYYTYVGQECYGTVMDSSHLMYSMASRRF